MSVARWRLLSKTPWTARSSHCMCATPSGHLLMYGGELSPRIPVDSATAPQDGVIKGSVHVFDLNDLPRQNGVAADHGTGWRTVPPTTEASGASAATVPDARVGATMVIDDNAVFLWGGRGGVDMSPLEPAQAGIWRGELKGTSEGDNTSILWDRISPENPEEGPEPRSYHASVSRKGEVYVHAGCPKTGRSGTLHRFDIDSRKWNTLSTAPAPPRGGTALVTTSLMSWGEVVLRYGGFSGYELPSVRGTIDLFDLNADRWYTVQPAADPIHGFPGPRSVHGVARFQSTSPALSEIVGVLFHGERDASKLGHAGAGMFWDDVWLLTKRDDSRVLKWSWKKVEALPFIEDGHVEGKGGLPEGRGWFAYTELVENGNTRVLMHGGLLSSNERSDELWELQIE